MADITTMVARLVAAGCSPDIAAQTVAEAYGEGIKFGVLSGAIPVDSAAEKRRAWDRERKRKQALEQVESGGIHRIPQSASLSKEEKKEESKEEREAPPEQRPRTNRGQRLPDDWQPAPPDQATATEQLGADRVRTELEKFRDHWKQQPGSKGVKLDWDAAWRNWIRRAAEYGGRNGNGSHGIRTNQGAGPPATRDATFIAAMGRTLERRRADRAAADPGRIDVPGRDDAASGPDADGGAASGDDEPSGQLAFLHARHAGS